jgi:enolase
MLASFIKESGYQNRVGLQIDVAAGRFYNDATGLYEGLFSKEPKTREQMITLVVRMAKEYPFIIIEDPLNENDFEGFAEITRNVDIQITADDLLVTDPDRLQKAITMKAGNALRVSAGQIGTVSEAFNVAAMAICNNFGVAANGERGEDIAICDYAVGMNAGTIGENGLTYSGNRLLQIEKELGRRVRFCGRNGIRGERFQL